MNDSANGCTVEKEFNGLNDRLEKGLYEGKELADNLRVSISRLGAFSDRPSEAKVSAATDKKELTQIERLSILLGYMGELNTRLNICLDNLNRMV